MDNLALLLVVICVPLFGAFFLPLAGIMSEKLRNWSALGMIGIPLLAAGLLLPQVESGQIIHFSLGGIDLFLADQLAVFMAGVSLLVGALIVFYSFGYIHHYEHRNEYYFMVVLFLGSMMGIVFSRNLIFIYLFWEITALACWRLIGFFREKSYVVRADKAFLVTVFGALMMLIGFIMVYLQTGSFDLLAIRNASSAQPISNIAVILILFGIFSKSATLPLHTWLPDAGVAPSPVTALLHAAVLVKIGVYVFARLFITSFTVDPIWSTVVPVIAGVSALVSAGAALVETDLKRIIAYSTISQLGFIFLGLAVGGEVALAGGLLYILMHSLAKGGLFLCAGIVEQKTHCKDITRLGGLITTMPITAVSFFICALSVMGVPPFGGFFSKYLVIAGAVNSGQFWIAAAFVLGAVMTVIYLFRVFLLVFLKPVPATDGQTLPVEGSSTMVFSVAALAVMSILGGLLISYPGAFVQTAVQQMLGVVR